MGVTISHQSLNDIYLNETKEQVDSKIITAQDVQKHLLNLVFFRDQKMYSVCCVPTHVNGMLPFVNSVNEVVIKM